MTLAIDILDQIFCVIQEKNSGVPRDSLWEERRWGEGGGGASKALVWLTVKVSVQ